MSSLLKWLPRMVRRSPSAPLIFSNSNFVLIPASRKVEEETYPDYLAARYYPVNIGDVFASRYQVVGKLGFGVSLTVWLARDLNRHHHVALKVFVRSKSLGKAAGRELATYKHIESIAASSRHPGRNAMRTVLDSFTLSGPDGEHQCLVHPALWITVKEFLFANPIGRAPVPVLAVILRQLFQALDFLHTECRLVHTDLKSDNIMFGAGDNAIFEQFEKEELETPCPRKEVDGRIIYVSRELGIPSTLAPPILCDFGTAVPGDEENLTDVQPNLYRAPEVIFQVPWSYPIDIWNAGCLVWDIFEGRSMFSGRDPEHNAYRGRAHVASIMSLLNPPPADLLSRGNLSRKFFSENGTFDAGIPTPPPRPLR